MDSNLTVNNRTGVNRTLNPGKSPDESKVESVPHRPNIPISPGKWQEEEKTVWGYGSMEVWGWWNKPHDALTPLLP